MASTTASCCSRGTHDQPPSSALMYFQVSLNLYFSLPGSASHVHECRALVTDLPVSEVSCS